MKLYRHYDTGGGLRLRDTGGMSGTHEWPVAQTDVWLTPRWILDALGPFDLDPCCADEQPWRTAENQYTKTDNGLMLPWHGRVWCNPPYGRQVVFWLDRMALHGNGIALILARTETEWFDRTVWQAADAALFVRGRIRFLRPDGSIGAQPTAPSVLVAYGAGNVQSLDASGIKGKLVELK